MTEEYDEEDDDLGDLQHLEGHDDDNSPPGGSGGAGGSGSNRNVRRRSSKACDQCRKSKCKCERSAVEGEPCRSCVMLGTECTFLGPSRKRGPPKGYIDAIENRLHQVEALLGVLIASNDPRAKSIMKDIISDPQAHEIVERVATSPYGQKARRKAAASSGDGEGHSHPRGTKNQRAPLQPFSSPINEWQEQVGRRITQRAGGGSSYDHDDDMGDGSALLSSPRRQRRRLDSKPSKSSLRSHPSPPSHVPTAPDYDSSSSTSSTLALGLGQLSLSENSQFRYHSKTSGLHLLAPTARDDLRNEGGIWRFPQARIWPPVAAGQRDLIDIERVERDIEARMPSYELQTDLFQMYFTYVHPILPIVDKESVLASFRASNPMNKPSPPAASPPNDGSSASTSTALPGSGQTPLLLLLAMWACAARFSSNDEPLPAPSLMWDAGDSYLYDAKALLNASYASSSPTTCQALLLLAYREIGIGAMQVAWLYTGMAVRMAQDLGMHRSAEGWSRVGRSIFGEQERQIRKKIWHACIVMDKYVSAYIGRPLAIFERDFDAPLPSEDELENTEMWEPTPFPPLLDPPTQPAPPPPFKPQQSMMLTVFNASATLSILLGSIVQSIYAVKSSPSITRTGEKMALEERLDKWYLELKSELRLDITKVAAEPDKCPPPHLFALHMQYWCTVLLLHRPFIRPKAQGQNSPPMAGLGEAEQLSSAHKSFDLCMSAADHITSTVKLYSDRFCLRRSPPFFTYYLFSAGIMYVTALSLQPGHAQAGIGLQKCMDCLKGMERTWPSAGRQWELLHGSKVDLREAELALSRVAMSDHRMNKRGAAEALESDFENSSSTGNAGNTLGGSGNGGGSSNTSGPSGHPIRLSIVTDAPGSSGHRASTGGGQHSAAPVSASSSAPSAHPFTNTIHPRSYHVGIDLSNSPTNTVPSMGGGGESSGGSLFPQFERWTMPPLSSSSNYGQHPSHTHSGHSHHTQSHHHQPQQHSMYGNQGGLMDTAPHIPPLAPRLPTSSARLPPSSSFWGDYGDSGVGVGGSNSGPSGGHAALYNLSLLSDPMTTAPGAPGHAPFFHDSNLQMYNPANPHPPPHHQQPHRRQ
ncbi:hypothetical protein SISSUDRAFT_1050132 [Sistotremastrum suecicum HHB10207 ss-3]|uniref:Zn(2)-C6 fungal-type domain-containing protein n=1 Tax=Sistotremastrum suecicum HHB10207 ss-3 TaxID=1314776 RepID=A0A166BE41_9AGAM|nr:hypothetical protein SISSUDRAFT_1050132 [Sistotremastrum suecicum HHB10207 ss-3]